MRMQAPVLRLLRREEGSVLLETALMITILLVLAFGMVDLGRAMFTENNLVSAAREAARIGAVNTQTAQPLIDSTKATAIHQFSAYGGTAITTANIAVVCSASADCSAPSGGNIQVTITYPFSWITPLPRLLRWTSNTASFHAQATYRYEL
jgi:Flp pilus assembly protein TadG